MLKLFRNTVPSIPHSTGDDMQFWQPPEGACAFMHQYSNGYPFYWLSHEGYRIPLIRGSCSLMPTATPISNQMLAGSMLYIIGLKQRRVINRDEVPHESSALPMRMRIKLGLTPIVIPMWEDIIFNPRAPLDHHRRVLEQLYPDHMPVRGDIDWFAEVQRPFGVYDQAEETTPTEGRVLRLLSPVSNEEG